MAEWNAFKGAAKRIEDVDLPRIGSRIGVGEDEIHAVMDVEAAGSGFDRLGRPRMLFEPHIFWRELGAGGKRDAAARAGLAYPKWKRDYPSDSYPRLVKAMAIDEEAALRSASWGLGQVMGFNAKLAGYDTASAMVRAFMEDEDKHLDAMISFIISAGLDDDLRRHDWSGFARGYNGAGYAANRYHLKLATAYAKWRKIPDTPWSPDQSVTAANENAAIDASPVALSRGDKGAEVEALQIKLRDAGFFSGPTNGSFGPLTEAAVRAFQKARGLTADGWAGLKTMAALDAALQTAPVVLPDQPDVVKAPPASEPPPPPAPALVEPSVPSGTVTDDQILQMIQAGVAELLRRKAA